MNYRQALYDKKHTKQNANAARTQALVRRKARGLYNQPQGEHGKVINVDIATYLAEQE